MKSPRPVRRLIAKVAEVGRRHRERHRPTGQGFAIADSIHYLNSSHWSDLTQGASVFLGTPYLTTLERNGPDEMQHRYAIIYRGRRPVACVAAQLVRIRASQVLGVGRRAASAGQGLVPRVVGGAKTKLRARALGLVRSRLLVCGNLFSWGMHGVAFAPDDDPATIWPAVTEALYRIRRSERLSGQTDIVMIKDIPDGTPGVAALERFSYRSLETDPDMVLDISPSWQSYDDYVASLASKYRKSARQTFQSVESAGCTVEPLSDWDAHATRLHELYLQVHERAVVRPVTLSPRFIPALAATFGEDFRCTIVKCDDQVLGFVTTLKDGGTAVAYFIGFDYAANAEIPIYFRLLHAVVADAIELGCRRLTLGRTALEPKARLGARPVPLRIWLRHRQPVMNWLVRSLLRAVPHGEAPERNPFK